MPDATLNQALYRRGDAVTATVAVPTASDPIPTVLTGTVPAGMRFGVAATVPTPGATWGSRAAEQHAPPTSAECFYVYYQPGRAPVWADRCAALPEDVDIWCQTKTADPAQLAAFTQSVPPRTGLVYWHYWNEPRDDIAAGTMTLQQYRDRTALVHAAIPPGHPTLIPSQEITEYDLRSGVDMRPYIIDTTRHVGFSVYDIAGRLDPAAQINRVATFMAGYPTITWGVAAAGRPVDLTHATDTDRQARAAWAETSYNAAKQAGATEWCWYDCIGINARDYRIATPDYEDQYMTAALTRARQP